MGCYPRCGLVRRVRAEAMNIFIIQGATWDAMYCEPQPMNQKMLLRSMQQITARTVIFSRINDAPPASIDQLRTRASARARVLQ